MALVFTEGQRIIKHWQLSSKRENMYKHLNYVPNTLRVQVYSYLVLIITY